MRYILRHIFYPESIIAKVVMMLLVFVCINGRFANAQTPREYQVKAVFLYNFAQFVDWPASAFSSPNDPFIIGIAGDDPFGDYLDATVSGETINGHPIVVQRYKNIKNIKAHILFINEDNKNRLKDILDEIGNRNTLTVSDSYDFVKLGGMIRFYTENNKTRLEINPDVARAAQLSISSKLLHVAKIADPSSPH